MRGALLLVSMFAFAAPLSQATPEEDAQVIVEMTVTEDVMASGFQALSQLIVGTFQNEAAKSGKALSDDAAMLLGKMVFDELVPLMTARMREEMASAYTFTLSPQALSDLRTFLETPSGTEWARAQSNLVLESTKIAESIASPVAMQAVERIVAAIEADEWPPGSLASSRAEITAFMKD